MWEIEEKGRKAQPVIVDTLPGRDMRTSHIERDNHDSPKTPHRQHLLSPSHQRKMKDLPY